MITLEIQDSLVKRKLAIRKMHDTSAGTLALFKYHRNVMYDYKWFSHPELRECRGHVYDLTTGELVQAAPRKSFNYCESGWWVNVPLDTKVKLYKKYNGFMACSTNYNGSHLVTTTGSFSGEYQQKALELLHHTVVDPSSVFTDLFEIIADFDPHIVDEGVERAVYLGARSKLTGAFYPATDTLYFSGTLQDALMFASEDKGEGFMMYTEMDEKYQDPAKLKTPTYVGMKRLMRLNAQGVHNMYGNPREFANQLPSMYAASVDEIVKTVQKDDWMLMDEQVRRKYIETTLKG